MNLQETKIEGEEIVIDDSKSFNAIGENTVLENCTLKISVPAKALSIRGTLLKTTVIAEKKLSGFSWLEAKIQDCKFLGEYKENEFGNLSDSDSRCETCDFSEATLDDCLVYGGLSETHTYPRWPSFVIIQPHQNFAEMNKQTLSDGIADVVDSIEFLDPDVSAMVLNATKLAGESGEDIENYKKFFSQYQFVRF